MQTPNLAGRALENGKAGSTQRGIDGEQDFIGIHSGKKSKVAEGHGACGRHEFIGLLAVLEIRHGLVALGGECDLAGANEARWMCREGVEDIQHAARLKIGSGSVHFEDACGHFDILLGCLGTGLDVDTQNFDGQILRRGGLHLLVGRRRELGVQAGEKKHGGKGGQNLAHGNLLAIASGMRKRIRADKSFGCRAVWGVIRHRRAPLMKKYLLPTLQAAVTLFIFAKLFGDASLRENAARALAAADFAWLVGAACAGALSEILCATRWWVILKAFGLQVRWRDAVAFSAVGLFYSLGLPGSAGGDAVRTLYLMRLFPDKKMASAFSVLADRLCGLAALVLFMAATLAWNHQTFLAGELGRGIVLSAASLLGGAILLLGLWWMTTIPSLRDFVKRRHPRFSPHLLESGAIFQQMAQRPGAVLTGCALALAALAAHFLGYFFSAKAFGSSLGIGSLFSIMPIVDTLTMLPVALYGLGLREALFNVLLGTFFGTPSATATLISLGGFGAQAVVALLGAAFLPFIKFLSLGDTDKK